MKKHIYFIFLFIVPLLFAKCGDSDNEKGGGVPIQSITITNLAEGQEISLATEETFQVTTSVTPSGATSSLVFESDYTNAFVVNKDGLITALNEGEGTLTIKSSDDLSVATSAKVKVYIIPVPTESLAISNAVEGVVEVEHGKTTSAVITALPEGVTNTKREFKSSDESIFTVDAVGKITSVSIGEAQLTVKALDGTNASVSCTVRVIQIKATAIRLGLGGCAVIVGESTDISSSVTLFPSNATVKKVVYTSSNTSVATVDENGILKGIGVGETEITVKTTDGSNLEHEGKAKVGTKFTEISREGFTVVASSEKVSDGGGKDMILNDDNGKFWHSSWDPDAPLPHTLIIDMQGLRRVSKVDIRRRTSNTNTRTVNVEGSVNGSKYVLLNTIKYGDTSNTKEDKAVEFYPTEFRFIRLTVTESNNAAHASISTFRVYSLD